MSAPIHSFTIKTTDYCNLACRYCYSPNASHRNRTDTSVIDRVIVTMQQDFDADQRFAVVWHGSEPMAAGIAFFRDALARFEAEVPGRVRHHVQTNLTLLDDAWIELLKARGVTVSTSIDGPRWLHDQNRVDFAGKGSFDRVVANIERLRREGIPISAILVLTRDHLDHGDEIFTFLKALDIPIRINPVLLPREDPGCLHPADYGRFVVDLAQRWLDEPGGAFYLEPIRSMVVRLVTGVTTLCEQQGLCYRRMNGVGTDGKLYPCNRFVGVDELALGSTGQTRLQATRTEALSMRAAVRHESNEKCRTCSVRDVCKGGCMYHAHVIYGDAFREDYFCESYVAMWTFITSNLGVLLSRLDRLPRNEHLDSITATLTQQALPSSL